MSPLILKIFPLNLPLQTQTESFWKVLECIFQTAGSPSPSLTQPSNILKNENLQTLLKFTRLWVNTCGQHVAHLFLLGSVVFCFPLGALPVAEVALESIYAFVRFQFLAGLHNSYTQQNKLYYFRNKYIFINTFCVRFPCQSRKTCPLRRADAAARHTAS